LADIFYPPRSALSVLSREHRHQTELPPSDLSFSHVLRNYSN